jgi:prepilin-type N-terminal cleavage/methylation domain-containing protein
VRSRNGFSLVEVVIAIGVLAVAITGVLALLPTLTRQLSDASDALVAQGLAGAVETELRRLAGEGSFDGVAGLIKPIGTSPTLTMVAPRDGREVREESASTVSESARYFLVELWQFPAAPLAYERATGAMLAARVKVSWPYQGSGRNGSAVESDPSARSSVEFSVAINR